MKRLIIIATLLVFAAITVATAADVMTFENKKGTITYNDRDITTLDPVEIVKGGIVMSATETVSR